MLNHNHNGKNHSSMMWMMLICMLPLVVLFFIRDKQFSAGYLWPILIGAFVVVHLWIMFKGHGRHDDANEAGETNTSEQPETKSKNTHSGGCH